MAREREHVSENENAGQPLVAGDLTVAEAADDQCAGCPCRSGARCTNYECYCGCDELLCVDCDPVNALKVGAEVEVALEDGNVVLIERVEPFYLIALSEGAYERDELDSLLREQDWRIIDGEVSRDEEDEGCWHVRVGRTCAFTTRYGSDGRLQRNEYRCACGYVTLNNRKSRSHLRLVGLDVSRLDEEEASHGNA